jgi:hypothetical protein
MNAPGLQAEQIESQARAVGFRAGSAPTLEGVERRRLQLWALAIGLLFAVSVGVAFISSAPSGDADGSVAPGVLRVAIVVLSLAFGAYTIEKEVHLRRLARVLTDQRVLTRYLTHRLDEMALLLEAGKAMNSVLELPAVLATILRSAMQLLSGESGSIMLLETVDEMVTVLADGSDASVGQRVRIGKGVVGRVAESRSAVLIEEHELSPGSSESRQAEVFHSGVCVPLIGRNVLFGVLTVHASADRRYSEYDVQAASLFAEQAASAIANARLYERERMRGDRADLAEEFRSLSQQETTSP